MSVRHGRKRPFPPMPISRIRTEAAQPEPSPASLGSRRLAAFARCPIQYSTWPSSAATMAPRRRSRRPVSLPFSSFETFDWCMPTTAASVCWLMPASLRARRTTAPSAYRPYASSGLSDLGGTVMRGVDTMLLARRLPSASYAADGHRPRRCSGAWPHSSASYAADGHRPRRCISDLAPRIGFVCSRRASAEEVRFGRLAPLLRFVCSRRASAEEVHFGFGPAHWLRMRPTGIGQMGGFGPHRPVSPWRARPRGRGSAR